MDESKIVINSWDELIDAGFKSLLNEIELDKLVVNKDLSLKILIRGENWDDRIDYRGAQYIVDLQKAVSVIYKDLVDTRLSLPELNKLVTVKVRIEKGSQILDIIFGKAVEKLMDRLNGKDILIIAVVGILCSTGYHTAEKVISLRNQRLQQIEERRQRIEEKKLQIQEKKLLLDYMKDINKTMDRALDLIERKDLEGPPRKLVGKLDENDSIQFPGQAAMSPEQAMQRLYPRKEPLRPESDLFDGNYIITQLNMEKMPVQFKLKKDEHEFWANAELSNADVDKIAKDLKAALQNKQELAMDLRLFIVYDKKKLKSATIQATGEPRKDSKRFIFLTSYWRKNK